MEFQLNLDKDWINNYWKNKDENFYHFLEKYNALDSNKLSDDPIFQLKLKNLTEECINWRTGQWAENDNEVIEILGGLSISQFAFLFNHMDFNYPGLSFYFVTECLNNQNWVASNLLLKKLRDINEKNFLDKIFTPMRTLLIRSLIQPDD